MGAAQVLREAQARMQQAPPPPGSSSPQKEGLGTTGDATRKEFEVTLFLTTYVCSGSLHGCYSQKQCAVAIWLSIFCMTQ